MIKISEKVRQVEGLSGSQKILLNQIVYLSTEKPCYASDKYFVKFFAEKLGHDLSSKTIWRWIKMFEKRGLIQKLSAGNKRRLIPLFLEEQEREELAVVVKKVKKVKNNVVAVFERPVWNEEAIQEADDVMKKWRQKIGGV